MPKAYHCDVVAATDGRLLQFPRSAFQAALENDRAFNRAWIRLLGWEGAPGTRPKRAAQPEQRCR